MMMTSKKMKKKKRYDNDSDDQLEDEDEKGKKRREEEESSAEKVWAQSIVEAIGREQNRSHSKINSINLQHYHHTSKSVSTEIGRGHSVDHDDVSALVTRTKQGRQWEDFACEDNELGSMRAVRKKPMWQNVPTKCEEA
jgi:hypothetical protein